MDICTQAQAHMHKALYACCISLRTESSNKLKHYYVKHLDTVKLVAKQGYQTSTNVHIL